MWDDNIKMDLKDIEWEDMDWIDMNRGQCKALQNTVMKFRILLKKMGNS
jgi:hypothetical protein